MGKDVAESDLVRIWQHQLLARASLTTEDGEPIEIIYPGWLNTDEGPDFRDAVIAIGGESSRGDIEVHIRSSGWQEHGHHRDASYNQVILHVVLRHNASVPARLQNGGMVPVLALEKYLAPLSGWQTDSSPPAGYPLPCRMAQDGSQEALLAALDRAGEERFRLKAALFEKDILRAGAGQCLYQGIMGALGYSRNKLPFLELARRVPLSLLESLTPANVTDADWLARRQGLLLGAAGLLPARYPDCPPALPREAWHMLKVRPNNSPVTRLVAMSYLLLRYRQGGLLGGLLSLVDQASSGRRGRRTMEDGLTVAAGHGQAGCPEFASAGLTKGQTLRLRSGQALLGSPRVADIVVNVLLPFACAWGQVNSLPERGRKALELYGSYPGLTVNSVEQYMAARLRLSTGQLSSARRQQGLIHIYKNCCSRQRCEECLLTKT